MQILKLAALAIFTASAVALSDAEVGMQQSQVPSPSCPSPPLTHPLTPHSIYAPVQNRRRPLRRPPSRGTQRLDPGSTPRQTRLRRRRQEMRVQIRLFRRVLRPV
jgi:hypothetical protein